MSDVAMLGRRAHDPAPGLSLSGASASRIHRVEAHGDPRAVLDEWRDLAAVSDATPYQTPDWLLPWIETVGAASGIAPMVVVARGVDGRAMALLPFGLVRQGALTIAVFLGAKDSNFNMGLFRPGPSWSRAAITDVLRRAGRASGRTVDLFALNNQPLAWQGTANPLMTLARQPSPSFAYKAELARDSEVFFKAHLSRESRKKLRQKMNRLQAFGTVEVRRARSPQEIAEVLDAFVEQRSARCAALGLPVDDIPLLRAFLDRATAVEAAGGEAPVEFHALYCESRILATLGGARRRGRFSGMLTSFTTDESLVRTSPGELLLAAVMRQSCEDGVATFDLGVGEARYKETYCRDVEPLFDSLVPLTARGHFYARAEALRLQAKRSIKQSAWAWPLVLRLRKAKALLSSGLPDRDRARED